MQITHAKTGLNHDILIELVVDEDYKNILKSRYFFDWKKEKNNLVYKLRLKNNKEILGLMSLLHFAEEECFEIKLLAVGKENRGKNKLYKEITGNLIACACREAIKIHGTYGCVSLKPKTELKQHYMKKYGMLDAGLQVFLEGEALFKLLEFYTA